MSGQAVLDVAKRRVKDVVLGSILPRRYDRAVGRIEVDPHKALFINGKLESIPDAFSLIMLRLERRYGFDVQFVGLGRSMRRGATYYHRCLSLMDDLASAKYVFLEDASDIVSCVDLRPETKVVQLWHACGAFKKWGMSTAELQFGETAEDIKRHPFYGNLSLVTVSSPEVVWAYREAMMLDGDEMDGIVQPLGVSRTDVYFDEGFADASREWLHSAFPHVGSRKVILYAPTFRGMVRTAKGPGVLDFPAMKRALGGEYALIVKHHPFVKSPPPIPESCRDFAALADSADPVDSLLVCADVLITDYSSIIFEYSLLSRPMVFFAYDLSNYCDWRGFYYDYDELTPGPVLESTEELITYIGHIGERFDKAEVVAFRNKFMSACDGQATERICDAVFTPDYGFYEFGEGLVDNAFSLDEDKVG